MHSPNTPSSLAFLHSLALSCALLNPKESFARALEHDGVRGTDRQRTFALLGLLSEPTKSFTIAVIVAVLYVAVSLKTNRKDEAENPNVH